MSSTKKIRVAVLYGGRSGEHEVSLLSAHNVIRNLDRTQFEVVPIGIDKQGAWFLGDDIIKKELSTSANLRLQRERERLLFNPDLLGQSVQALPLKEQTLASSDRMFDVVFPVIHGPLCEDGTVQGLLELANIPYVGCGVLSSAIGMDKDISKRLVQNAGLNIPPFATIKIDAWQHDPAAFCALVAKKLTFPVFVKPVNTGSSVGVQKVKNQAALSDAIEYAFHYDTKVIVEQGVQAVEIECAVLEALEPNSEPIVSVVGEIKPSGVHEFYSYASKYLDEHGAELIIPAPLEQALQDQIQKTARQIFLTLECEGMARVDLFLEKETQKIYFNEINTIPGFTEISMYPKLMAASGIPYKDLLTHLIKLAMNRQTKKNKISREYQPV